MKIKYIITGDTMKKKDYLQAGCIVSLALILLIGILIPSLKSEETKKIKATVLSVANEKTTILTEKNEIYTLAYFNDTLKSGDYLSIEYTGVMDITKETQEVEVISYVDESIQKDENGIPLTWKDDGIFSDYYIMAINKLKELSLDEKIGQLLLAKYPGSNAPTILKQYPLSGFVFLERDFTGKTKEDVDKMINDAQKASKIPLLTAVDEEGGNIVRISNNANLVPEKFKSPQELYTIGGFEEIKKDTKEKSKVLKDLGLNLNLAPVVDVSTDPTDYIYPRTLGKDATYTSTYAKTVIESSKDTGVSYTLKHFPGYGNNRDTHTGSSVDTRPYDDIMNNDILPFKEGIKALAEAVLISHNIVNAFDGRNPASLSSTVHNILTSDLDFTGVSITDDLSMNALDSIDDTALKAILAGNDLIITTDYETSFNELKRSVENGTIDESVIERHTFKVLAWKYYKGLMLTQTK